MQGQGSVGSRLDTRSVMYASGGAFGFTRTLFAGMPTYTWIRPHVLRRHRHRADHPLLVHVHAGSTVA